MSDKIEAPLTPEQRKEHTAFLTKIIETKRKEIFSLTEPRALLAQSDVVEGFEDSVQTRAEFVCWGQADPPFTREMWNAVSALAENYRLECERDGKGDSEIAEAAQAAADRIEALLPPETK